MPQYGDPSYWDKRYTEYAGSTFDWLENYDSLKQLIDLFVKPEDRILQLGCGNSIIQEQMYDDGFTNITNVDISSVVISQMAERSAESRPLMTYQVADITDMSKDFSQNQFDVVLDKSTIDALLCGDRSFIMTAKMLKEVQRVLKIGGYYIMISYGDPESRLFHLEREFLSFKIRQYKLFYEEEADKAKNDQPKDQENDDPKIHYIYVCKKLEDADEISKKYFPFVLKKLELEEAQEQ